MNSKSNLAIIFLSLLLVASVGAISVLYVMKENERKEKLSLKGDLNRLEKNLKKLESQVQEYQNSKVVLEERIKFQDEKIDELGQRVQAAELERDKAKALVEAKQAEIDQLKVALQNAEKEKQDLLNRLDKQYSDYYEMKFQLSSILKTKEELEKKAKTLAENAPISLGTVVIRQAPQSKK